MKCNYILGLDKVDMIKIRGFRLRLVNLFFPILIEVLKETASKKATYKDRWLDGMDCRKKLMDECNKLILELNELKVSRDERLRKAETNHSMDIKGYQIALLSEQADNERLKKKIKALHKTITKLKGQNSNKPKHNEVERSGEVSSNERRQTLRVCR